MRDILLLQLGRLGDLVQTLPLMRRLREEHPGCRITVVCLETFHGILAESGGWDTAVPVALADVDALADPAVAAVFPDLAPWNRFPILAGEFDLLVNLTHDLGSAVLAERIRAARKLGRLPAPQGELRLKGSWSKYPFSMV
ncbi:MAG TPA: hypothetical protein VK465_02580, partial [Fibrobacteria bacterium]|nr:hypothetical protein [Fibrobacteria bacterium]